MNNSGNNYLPHLKKSLPRHAKGYSIGGYSIALEGWRRGLNLKIKFDPQKKARLPEFVLNNSEKSHYFYSARGDLIYKEAREICRNKEQTKEFLIKNNINTPKFYKFDAKNTNEDFLNFANKLGYPVVLKPTQGRGGKGVIANINSNKEMLQAITYVRDELKYEKFIVEEFLSGEDHRLYVVGDEVVGIFKRYPARVIGNGTDTIKVLLRTKNIERMKIPSLKDKPIKVDKETIELLVRSGYTMESIPSKGEVVTLKTKNNISSGGEAVDVTDEIKKEIKQTAVKAVKSIPGLGHAGVDMMINEEQSHAGVIEINSQASIRTHLFPSYGKARDIPSALIDYYFPETKGHDHDKTSSSKLYFDFDHVYQSCINGSSDYIDIPSIPSNIELKRLLMTSNKHTKKLENWLRTNAVKNQVSGYFKKTRTNRISLIIAGNRDDIDRYIKLVVEKSIDSVEYKVRKTPVMQGFHIVKGISEKKDLLEENKKLKDEVELLNRRHEKILNSISWKITIPLRVLKKALNRF